LRGKALTGIGRALSKSAVIYRSYAGRMRRSFGPGVALLFAALLVVRHAVLRSSAHFAHGAERVLIVVVALLAVAGIRLLVSRR
jgi:hypothetical protein